MAYSPQRAGDTTANDPSKGCVAARNLIIHCFKCVNADQLDRAVSIYSSCQEDIGYQMIQMMPTNPPFRRKLAKMFYMARDFEKAAVILESLKDYAKAAHLYEMHGDYSMASELYARTGEDLKAAQMCEKCGRFEEAAKLYSSASQFDRAAVNFERAINNYLAGQMYHRMNKVNKALECLQRVDERDGSYLDAVALIGEILTANNYHDLAVSKYESVLKNQGVRRDSLAVAYNYAGLLAQLGRLDKAREIYNKILDVDFQYRDAGERLHQLGGSSASAPVAPEALEEDPIEELTEVLDAELEEAPEAEIVEMDDSALARVQDMGTKADVVGMMEGFEFLKGTPIFADLSLGEMKTVYSICDTRLFKDGEIVIEQDQPGRGLFILKKGRVAVQKVAGSAVKTIVELGPGVHVGEMSLVDEAPTSARVTAVEPTEAFEISRERYEKLLFTNDKIALKLSRVFIRTLADRLRKTSVELAQARAENDQLQPAAR